MMLIGLPPELLRLTGSFLKDPLDYFRFKKAMGKMGRHLSNVFILGTTDLPDYDRTTLSELMASGCFFRLCGPPFNGTVQNLLDFQNNEFLFDYVGSLTDDSLPIPSVVDLLFEACRQDSPELLDLLVNQFQTPDRYKYALNATKGYETVLTFAIALKSRRIIPRLIQLGFDSNRVTGGSVSALGVALWAGDTFILDYLLNVCHARMVSSRTTIFEFIQSETLRLLPDVVQCYLKERYCLC